MRGRGRIGMAILALWAFCGSWAQAQPLRPPSVPLVAHDPYFSIWSPADKLTEAVTTHWTGKPQPLNALVRVDKAVSRVLGMEPRDCPALAQDSIQVLPTRTIAVFRNEQIRLTLTFLTPALPADLDVLSRPLTYVIWDVVALDGQPHEVQVLFEASPALAVDTPVQPVTWKPVKVEGLSAGRVGSVAQDVLVRQGDDLRIDWGWLYLAAPAGEGRVGFGDAAALRRMFRSGDNLTLASPSEGAASAHSAPSLAAMLDLGAVQDTPISRMLMLAYDDEWSIRYFEEDLRPYWRRKGMDAESLLRRAREDFPKLREACVRFDDALRADLQRVGGPAYAELASLCYRQTLAGCKLAADRAGQPLLFPKENHSNGCIGTIDVIYPMAPFTLALSPALTRAMLIPVLDYASSPRWKFDYAPHDLGRYPHATGQVYGGGERTDDAQMMVEESANMVLLVAAAIEAERSTALAERYWPVLTKWTRYLRQHGLDPENQLCTDDFAGHLAHNVNLSAKAIVALAAYGRMCEKMGRNDEAREYTALARSYAKDWMRMADDGTHYRLAFDKPGTWSQKYNLVWDRLLGLKAFPPEVARRELDFYRTMQQTYGLPLDSRSRYTKLDWIVWTACLTGERADFDALIQPAVRFVNSTPDRSPLTDWYYTDTAKKQSFTARPVVGGVFIPLLGDAEIWSRWAKAGAPAHGTWAPIPIRSWTEHSPSGADQPTTWQVRYSAPENEDWHRQVVADAPGWEMMPAPLGRGGSAGYAGRGGWERGGMWMRRTFTLPAHAGEDLRWRVAFSSPIEIYLNGVLAARLPGDVRAYQHYSLSAEARRALRPGTNVLAVHVPGPAFSTRNRARIDVSLIELGAPASAP